AEGTAVGGQLLVGHLRGHGLAVEAAALALEEVAGVDGFLHVAARFLEGLAHLAGDETRQRLLLALDGLADQPDDLPADGGGGLRPGLEGRTRRLGGLAHLLLAGLVEAAEDVGLVGGVAALERGRPRDLLAPVQVGVDLGGFHTVITTWARAAPGTAARLGWTTV